MLVVAHIPHTLPAPPGQGVKAKIDFLGRDRAIDNGPKNCARAPPESLPKLA